MFFLFKDKEDDFDKFLINFNIDQEYLEEIILYKKKEIIRIKDFKKQQKKELEFLKKAKDSGIQFSVSPADTSKIKEYETLFESYQGLYAIKLLPKAYKKYKKYSEDLKNRFYKKLKKLSLNPLSNDIKKIKGKNFDLLRLRVGEYRILFQKIEELKTIFILLIAHRKDSYNEL